MAVKNKKIAIIGLGYVGLPLAVEFGKKYPVIGFDINAARIAALISGHDSTLEVDELELKQDKKIYVAGHRGLVGSAIVRKLLME